MKKLVILTLSLPFFLIILLSNSAKCQIKDTSLAAIGKSVKTAIVVSPGYRPASSLNVIPYTIVSNEVRVHVSSNPQSEIHLSINKLNPQVLLLSSNTTQINNCIQGAYWSTNGGASWTGADVLPNNCPGKGDPSTAFDALGNGFVATMVPVPGNFNADAIGYSVQMTSNSGYSWGNQTYGANNMSFDKPMIGVDDLPTSPYVNNLYCSWMGAGNIVQFNRSLDHGTTYSAPINLTNYWGQGANVQTGVNGEVYLCWADYNGDNPTNNRTSLGLDFCSSVNGGASFSAAQRVISYTGIRQYNQSTQDEENPLFNNIRVNDFPSMSVDKSTGNHRGRIYVTLPVRQNGNGKAIVQVSYSDNQGVNWSVPVTVSISNATQSWFPWVSVDALTGIVSVVYYAFDQPSGFSTNTYVATSIDGGATFFNQKVSSVAHTTAPINGFNGGYEGDYIGIASYGMKAYPAWMDNRTGQWQNYVATIDNTPVITGNSAFCTSSTFTASNLPPNSTVSWSASPTGVVSLSPSGNSVTVTKLSLGYVTLTATVNQNTNISGSLGITTIPSVTAISATMSGPCSSGYQTWYLSATPNMAATNWQWTVDNPASGFYNIFSPNSQSTYVSVSGGGGISVTYKDPCGETSYKNGVTIYSPCGRAGSIVAFPNPANNQLTIQQSPNPTTATIVTNDNTASLQTVNNFSVELYNAQGQILKTGQTTQASPSIVLNTRDISSGTYFLHIKLGTDLIEQQIIIHH